MNQPEEFERVKAFQRRNSNVQQHQSEISTLKKNGRRTLPGGGIRLITIISENKFKMNIERFNHYAS